MMIGGVHNTVKWVYKINIKWNSQFALWLSISYNINLAVISVQDHSNYVCWLLFTELIKEIPVSDKNQLNRFRQVFNNVFTYYIT